MSVRNLEPSLITQLTHALSEVWLECLNFIFLKIHLRTFMSFTRHFHNYYTPRLLQLKHIQNSALPKKSSVQQTHCFSSTVISLVHCIKKKNIFLPKNNKDQRYASNEVLKISAREILCLQIKLKCCPTRDESNLPWDNISSPETEQAYGSFKAE